MSTSSGAGFIPIGKNVYLRPGQRDLPTNNTSTPTPTSPTKGPTVILIFGWMSAQLPHLHKYTEYYSAVYPQATQILVRSHPAFFFSSNKTNEALLAPVVDELEAAGCIPPSKQKPSANTTEPPRILVHVFSNGGASGLTDLARILSRRPTPTPTPTPPYPLTSILVLDSCPGTNGLSTALNAFSLATPRLLPRLLTLLAVLLLFAYELLRHCLLRAPRRFDALAHALLDPHLLPWAAARAPRVYVFSKADALVPCAQVQAHAEQARGRGMDVRVRVFERTGHVAHMRADPGAYWALIGEAWGDAWRAEEGVRN